MDHERPPHSVLQKAGVTVLPEVIRPREGRAWLVDWHGECGVLRHAPVSEDSLSSIRSVDDVIWIHAFLERLVELDFPSPKPLPAFDGKSWTRAGGVLWEIVSFLPGDAVGWADEPPMEEIGAMLARYHAAARQVQVSSQRPKALPLAEVPSVLLGHETQVIHSHYQRSVIRKLADQLAKDLDESGHRDRATLVFTETLQTTTSSLMANRRTRPALSTSRWATPKRRWLTSATDCGVTAVPTRTPTISTYQESGGSFGVTRVRPRSRPTKPVSFRFTCGVVASK
jgi:hypothetical protein